MQNEITELQINKTKKHRGDASQLLLFCLTLLVFFSLGMKQVPTSGTSFYYAGTSSEVAVEKLKDTLLSWKNEKNESVVKSAIILNDENTFSLACVMRGPEILFGDYEIVLVPVLDEFFGIDQLRLFIISPLKDNLTHDDKMRLSLITMAYNDRGKNGPGKWYLEGSNFVYENSQLYSNVIERKILESFISISKTMEFSGTTNEMMTSINPNTGELTVERRLLLNTYLK